MRTSGRRKDTSRRRTNRSELLEIARFDGSRGTYVGVCVCVCVFVCVFGFAEIPKVCGFAPNKTVANVWLWKLAIEQITHASCLIHSHIR